MIIKRFFLFIWNNFIKPVLRIPFIILKTVFSMLVSVFNLLVGKLRFSITFRITLVYMLIVTLTLSVLSVGALLSGFNYILKSETDDLNEDFKMISGYLQEGREIPIERINKLAEISGNTVTIFNDQQQVLYTTETKPENTFFINDNFSGTIAAEYKNSKLIAYDPDRNGDSIPRELFNKYGFALTVNDTVKSASGSVYIQLVNKLVEETEYAWFFVVLLIVMNIFFMLLIIIIGVRTSRKVLKPIHSMNETVRNITVKDLDTRIDISGSQNELKDLARTFNNMLDRIQGAYDRQNQFVSDASHELRTPIAVIQGYISVLDRWGKDDRAVLEESIAAIKIEAENMKDLIEKLLFLARGDKGTQNIEKTEFQLNELIDEVIKETRLIDDSHQIECEGNEAMMLLADRGLLKEALRVFVDNSVKYTPENGAITLECFAQKKNAVIVIEDTGIGISKEELPLVFDRFYRADKSRTKQTGGTGLGLAIAKWIILKHDGTIGIQSDVGMGTKITISLPLKK